MTPGDVLISHTEARVASLAVRLVSFAELLRLVPRNPVSSQSVEAALKALAEEDVARHVATADLHSADQMAEALTEALTAIEDSPMPGLEWEPISEIIGDDLLERLLAVSASSIHRYRSGERSTPDPVAVKLHFLSLIVADLTGSYNDFGIRRWFGRPRSTLSGRSPVDILNGSWGPDDDDALTVRVLAASLLSPQAT